MKLLDLLHYIDNTNMVELEDLNNNIINRFNIDNYDEYEFNDKYADVEVCRILAEGNTIRIVIDLEEVK